MYGMVRCLHYQNMDQCILKFNAQNIKKLKHSLITPAMITIAPTNFKLTWELESSAGGCVG